MLSITCRPKMFKQVVGNSSEVKALRTVLSRDNDELPHAFLFVGPSGCGKTTLARITARKLGCRGRDLSEWNASAFRGIDSAREIVRMSNLMPVGKNSTCKVWLLEECHGLSKDAQEALLHLLEDGCPKQAFFILTTTEPEKLKETFKRRCSTYTVAALLEEELKDFLTETCAQKKTKVPEKVIDQIVLDSLGSCGIALAVLDKIINLPPKEMLEAAEKVAQEKSESIELCRKLFAKAPWKVISAILRGLTNDPEGVRRQVLQYCASVLLKKDNAQAYIVMDAFRETFFYSGRPGLVLACYEAVKREE